MPECSAIPPAVAAKKHAQGLLSDERSPCVLPDGTFVKRDEPSLFSAPHVKETVRTTEGGNSRALPPFVLKGMQEEPSDNHRVLRLTALSFQTAAQHPALLYRRQEVFPSERSARRPLPPDFIPMLSPAASAPHTVRPVFLLQTALFRPSDRHTPGSFREDCPSRQTSR